MLFTGGENQKTNNNSAYSLYATFGGLASESVKVQPQSKISEYQEFPGERQFRNIFDSYAILRSQRYPKNRLIKLLNISTFSCSFTPQKM